MLSRYFASRAWLSVADGLASDVLVTVDDGVITAVEANVVAPSDAVRLPGFVMPGLVNAHSHAFHRALRSRTHKGSGDFWSWREQMYTVVERLDPDGYLALARATYAEMVLAGITTVCEFHYLHHGAGGVPYDNPSAMDEALATAAAEAGIRLVLLDTCYLQADVDGKPLEGPQRRFGDRDADAWALRAEGTRDALRGKVSVGAAIHSVRGCSPEAMRTVAAWADGYAAPLHLHLSEQVKENRACLHTHGRTPTGLCADTGVLGPRTTAVHATHLVDADIALLGQAAAIACFCPTTERDLADGIGPAARLTAAGAGLSLGSDSHAVIDLFEEARAVELNARLDTQRRGQHGAASLLAAATEGGAASAGIDGGIAVGRAADFIAVDTDSVRTAGGAADPIAMAVFAATASDVTHVVGGGRLIVDDRRHRAVPDVGAALEASISPLFAD
ncbi:MAG TPA: formimidoylglutamate deiminase [Stackebrandtia sp.]|uniref:formimidoylglutamate deiminase n=1 Tax=Stackebrandtia sp. TaxID=2023065 RepID=UPI002D29B350|nr:formimidoylglutamate deiminase [Stackebrandtia sp.]HZE42018.1 formimidoylglutamate deiminase [Stackebrandtia sp.]